jgi:RNase P subunit RPR2
MKCHDCHKPITGRKHVVSRPVKNHGAIQRYKAVVVCGECAKEKK